MKNITVAVSGAVYHDARVWAAKRDTSISATVQYILENLPVLARAMRAIREADLASIGITPATPAAQSPATPINPAPGIAKQTPRFSAAKL